MPQLMFYAKINDHGVRRGNTGQILTLWQRPVTSRVALDLPCWAMHTVSHRHIAMTIKMTSEGGVFFAIVDLLSFITLAKQSCYGQYKLNTRYTATYYHA
jgi:hypothetical protein